MINKIKKLIPSVLISKYHFLLAHLSAIYYGRPSEKLVVIGVTGTNGKTSTCELIAKVIEENGFKVGLASTAKFKIADREWLNDKKMTMLGRFALQKLLKQMVNAGCGYAVVETSSQGIEQFRHSAIHYDVCVFTNLTPEHIEAHGGFENYKKAKLKLFKHLENSAPKKIKEKLIEKAIVVNGDDLHAVDFLNFNIKNKIIFGLQENCNPCAQNISYQKSGVVFEVGGERLILKLFGLFNVYNALASIAVADILGFDRNKTKSALEKINGVPGRMELIDSGRDFLVLVDYAPEPESLRQLFFNIKQHQLVEGGKIIHVFGSCGGGRDISRRPILGEISAHNSEICIITNEDPYDDDPQEIIDQVAEGAIKSGKQPDVNLFKILDRKEAIAFALDQAESGDLVVLTGKGCEQAICVANNKKINWDERQVVKELLRLV